MGNFDNIFNIVLVVLILIFIYDQFFNSNNIVENHPHYGSDQYISELQSGLNQINTNIETTTNEIQNFQNELDQINSQIESVSQVENDIQNKQQQLNDLNQQRRDMFSTMNNDLCSGDGRSLSFSADKCRINCKSDEAKRVAEEFYNNNPKQKNYPIRINDRMTPIIFQNNKCVADVQYLYKFPSGITTTTPRKGKVTFTFDDNLDKDGLKVLSYS